MKTVLSACLLGLMSFTLVACAKAEDAVTKVVNNIDGSYSATAYGFDFKIDIDGETITGETSLGMLDSDVSGSVDLKRKEIDLDLTEKKSISGTYEKLDNGDLEVEFAGSTIVFEKE